MLRVKLEDTPGVLLVSDVHIIPAAWAAQGGGLHGDVPGWEDRSLEGRHFILKNAPPPIVRIIFNITTHNSVVKQRGSYSSSRETEYLQG